MIWNPVGVLNTYIGISITHPQRKDVGNDKNLFGNVISLEILSLFCVGPSSVFWPSIIIAEKNFARKTFPNGILEREEKRGHDFGV
jgi:hypothetical protein